MKAFLLGFLKAAVEAPAVPSAPTVPALSLNPPSVPEFKLPSAAPANNINQLAGASTANPPALPLVAPQNYLTIDSLVGQYNKTFTRQPITPQKVVISPPGENNSSYHPTSRRSDWLGFLGVREPDQVRLRPIQDPRATEALAAHELGHMADLRKEPNSYQLPKTPVDVFRRRQRPKLRMDTPLERFHREVIASLNARKMMGTNYTPYTHELLSKALTTYADIKENRPQENLYPNFFNTTNAANPGLQRQVNELLTQLWDNPDSIPKRVPQGWADQAIDSYRRGLNKRVR